jgi:hypothetical protein
MTAIIKNNFRLQNARDFLENFTGHPRTLPLNNNITINDDGSFSDDEQGRATLNLTWSFDRTSDSQDNTLIKNDSVVGLKDAIGGHTQDRNHYLFVGKPTVWGDGSQNDELYPVAPQDTMEEEARIWDEMLGLKKITETTASLVVPRFDWDSSGKTVYAVFDDKDPNLHRQPTPERAGEESIRNLYAGSFYALTDEFDVFVCLENGNNSPSTEKPVRKTPVTDLVDYSDIDGYVWKYITRIKQSDIVRFLTDSWIPVKTLTKNDNSGSYQWEVQEDATPGAVLSFVVEAQGSGFVRTHSGKLTGPTNISEGGVVKGQANLSALTGGAQPSGSVGHYSGCEIHIVSGDGQGSVYKIESYDGAKITLTSSWKTDSNGVLEVSSNSEYQILPELRLESNGTSPVKAKPILTGDKVSRVLVLSGGSNATYVKATLVNSAGGTGARVRAVLSPVKGLGKDPEKDLGAFFVMLNAKLQYSEGAGDFPINNDYRQIGIIRNVKNNEDGKLATKATLIATKKLLLTGISSGNNGLFRSDELISMEDASGNIIKVKVLDYIPSTTVLSEGALTYIQTPETGYGIITSGLLVTGETSGCEATIKPSGVVSEEIKKFEGEILYLENRRPVLRSSDQVEDIKAIIEF